MVLGHRHGEVALVWVVGGLGIMRLSTARGISIVKLQIKILTYGLLVKDIVLWNLEIQLNQLLNQLNQESIDSIVESIESIKSIIN